MIGDDEEEGGEEEEEEDQLLVQDGEIYSKDKESNEDDTVVQKFLSFF